LRAIRVFRQLIDAGLLEIGDGYRAKNAELGGSGPIFLRSAYLQDSGFVENMPERFKETDIVGFGAKVAQSGDVVITTKGNSTGRVGVIRDPQIGAVYSPHLSYWRSKDATTLDQGFLQVWSSSPEFRTQLSGRAYSTDMAPYLSLRDQLSLSISLPPLPEQRAIASVLSALDDKIELNRRMNGTLERQARALFRDWFVDFGPTRAKMALSGTATKNEQTRDAPYLAPEIWSLFPDRLDDDGVPEGWESESVIEQAEWINGAAYKNMHFDKAPDALPVIKIAELKAGVTQKTKWTNTALGDKYRISDGELLFSWSGNPDTSIDTFIWTGGDAWLNQHIFAVRSNGTRSPAFLYTMLKWLKPEFAEIARNKQTTGLGHVTKQDLKRLKVHIASNELLEEFEALVGPIHARMRANLFESGTLAQTRDLLLPKLMSGEIRMREAEQIAEAVL